MVTVPAEAPSPAAATEPKTLYFSKEPSAALPEVLEPAPAKPALVVPPPVAPAVVVPPPAVVRKPATEAVVAPAAKLAPPAPAAPKAAIVPPRAVKLPPPVVSAPAVKMPPPFKAPPVVSTPREWPAAAFDIQRTVLQEPKGPNMAPGVATGSSEDYAVQLQPPGSQRLFRLESEMSLQERMRQEARQRPTPERIQFPVEPDISGGKAFEYRMWKPLSQVVEPAYVCYGRLLFEDRNAERYGWDLGFIQPFVSASLYVKDFVLLPYHLASTPCSDCNTGYCLPGDPTPFLLYPPGLSVTGVVAEGAVIVGIAALFP